MEEKTRIERIEDKLDMVVAPKGDKKKKFRIPGSGKLSRGKLKRGYVTVQVINENDSIEFTKEPIIGGTISLGDTYHAVSDLDVLNYKGKPFVILPRKSKNPYNPNRCQNETYGQKHIKSRLLNETLKNAKKMGLGLSIGAIVIVGIIIYAFIAG